MQRTQNYRIPFIQQCTYKTIEYKQNKYDFISIFSLVANQKHFFRYFSFLKKIMKYFFEISKSFGEINRFKYKFKLKVLLELSQSISLLPIVNIESDKSWRQRFNNDLHSFLFNIVALINITKEHSLKKRIIAGQKIKHQQWQWRIFYHIS